MITKNLIKEQKPISFGSAFSRAAHKSKILFYFLFLLIVPVLLKAQSGANDASFNPGDVGFGAGDGVNNSVTGLCIQSDGKILVGGAFTAYNGVVKQKILRLNHDFSADATFISTVGASSNVNAIVEQPDGKIIIGGQFTSYSGLGRNRISRLNTNGTNDVSFTPGTGANSTINVIALQPDGKIIIGGVFTAYNGTTVNRIARLDANGTLDATFNIGTGASSVIYAIELQPDGKILVGGAFTTFNGVTSNRIVRLNADGTVDSGFTPGTAASSTVYGIKVQPDNQILIAGAFTTYNGTARARIARLNTNGTLETAFNPGTGANNIIYSIGLQADGKVILAGNFTTVNGTSRIRLARLTTTGSLDLTYTPGTGADATINVCAIQADTMAVLGGTFLSYNGTTSLRLNRVNVNGALDVIIPITGANDVISSAALQADGKIVFGGSFIAYNSILKNRIARANTDGSYDAGFSPGTGSNGIVQTISLQPDGKIIVGGAFTTYNAIARSRIARLSSTGSLDATFTPGTGANSTVYSTCIQPDGNIIVGGAFTTYNATARNRITRITSTGALDATFNPGTGANNIVYASAVQSDGKILVGGYFTTFNGVAKNRLVRLNADGTIDNTFNIGTGFNSYVWKIVVQPDGKILIGGQFTTYNGATARALVRLNTDGTLDSSFPTGTNFPTSSSVISINLQPDGKIIVAGSFASYSGTACNRIARLNANGTLDATVNTTSGANNVINASLLQADGNVVIGGQFTSFGGVGRNRIARMIILSGINITATAQANGSLTPAGTTVFNSGDNQVYNISPSPGYCVQDVLVDGVSVGAVTSYTFTNITVSHTIDVSFTAQLVPSLSITSGFVNDAICAGSTVTFTATPTNGGSSPAYQWEVNGNNMGSGTTYSNSSLVNGDVVTCILTANNACQSTATAGSNTITISVTNIVNTIQSVSICPGQNYNVGVNSYASSGTYIDTLISATGCDSVITTDLTVLPTNIATQNVSVCNGQSYTVGTSSYSSSGSYTDTLVSVAGCDSILTTHLTVMNSVNVGTSMPASDTLHALNAGATSYQWVDCNGGYAAIPGETNQSFGVTSNGDYAVIVYEGSCSDTSTCVSINLIGIEEDTDKITDQLIVFPNPGHGTLNINSSSEAAINIINIVGEVIYSDTISSGNNRIDLQKHPGGVYILSVLYKDGKASHHRFIIEK